MGVPVIAALASLHGMVPPHPGPLTAIATLKTSVGPTMVYGFISAIPAIILAGPVYARFIAPRMSVRPDQALLDQFTAAGGETASSAATTATTNAPIGVGVLAVLMPAILMLANTLGETLLSKNSPGAKLTAFLGDPLVAMLAGVLFASITLVYLRGGSTEKLRDALGASLKPIAGILLIIAGGGAFQQILVKAKVGDAIVHLTQHFSLPPLLLGWLIAMLLSVSTGSATVGIVGAAGLLAPLATANPFSICRCSPLPSARVFVLQLRQSRRLLAGEGVLWDDDGRGHKDDLGHPVDRRPYRFGHGASHGLVSRTAVVTSPGKKMQDILSRDIAKLS